MIIFESYPYYTYDKYGTQIIQVLHCTKQSGEQHSSNDNRTTFIVLFRFYIYKQN